MNKETSSATNTSQSPDPARSKEYHRMKNHLFFVNLFLDVVVLSIFFFSGLSGQLKSWAIQYSSAAWIFNGMYITVFSLMMSCVHFPLSFFSEYIWEHRFELSNQTWQEWLIDDIKKTLLGLLLMLILVEGIYFFLAKFPTSWWIWAGAFWLTLSFVLAKIMPNVIIPIFYKYKSIDDEGLRQRIFQLFKKCGVALKDVYAIDFSKKTKKANAFLCGMGNNRRVVLSDTLISDFSADEIESVVAHELGHYKHRDIFKLLLLNTAVIFLSFYLMYRIFAWAVPAFGLTGIDDIAFFPMFMLAFIVFGLIVTPALNAYSRYLERAADLYSLQQVPQVETFISMMDKLGVMNLAEQNPSRLVEIFFYDHPPLEKRIAFAKKYAASV